MTQQHDAQPKILSSTGHRGLRNAATLLATPRMWPWWFRWVLESHTLKLPFGGIISTFSGFSDFWSIRNMVPSSAECRLIEKTVLPQALNLDVGANVGVFTIAMAKVCSSGHVHAFEPVPETFARLRDNVTDNALTNVRLHCLALGREAGSASFGVNSNSPATNRFATIGMVSESHIQVDVSTVDSVVSDSGAAHFGLLKIDVEGFEADVLAGAAESIKARLWKAVLIEVCPANLRRIGSSVGDLVETCDSLGCSLFHLSPSGDRGVQLRATDLEQITLCNVLVERTDC